MSAPLLAIRDLRVTFRLAEGTFPAVDGLDLDVYPAETLCVVGESGCGKSVTALSVLRLLPEPPAAIESGEVLFEGNDLLKLPLRELRKIRGSRISMVFQEPMTALNPVFSVGSQIEEVLKVHTDLGSAKRRRRVVEMLDRVGMPEPDLRLREYPHQLSGGMRQRVMIAMALVCEPRLLIADEPTTALDVTIQAQILELIERLKQRLGMAVLLITHDLGVVAETAQRVAVLYSGHVVETGPVEAIFAAPRHPYTLGLLKSVPGEAIGPRQAFHTIPGIVPDLLDRPTGCHFRERCERARPICAEREPELSDLGGGRAVACHNPVPVGRAPEPGGATA